MGARIRDSLSIEQKSIQNNTAKPITNSRKSRINIEEIGVEQNRGLWSGRP